MYSVVNQTVYVEIPRKIHKSNTELLAVIISVANVHDAITYSTCFSETLAIQLHVGPMDSKQQHGIKNNYYSYICTCREEHALENGYNNYK